MIRRISIIQYGLGQVGQALLRQILAGRERLAARRGLELRHVALADSSGLLADEAGLGDAALRTALESKAQGVGLGRLPGGQRHPEAKALQWPGAPAPAIVVDVTAADGMEAVARGALARGWGVVLANKRPLAGSLETFRELTTSQHLRYEATVGAGLPWIEALTHLLDTGDRVLRLEAAVSGTLGFIATQLESDVPFSAAVAEARSRGYTEPDPRDDLSAADVRRKGLILGRLLGLTLSWEDLPVEPLYPPAWDGLDLAGFTEELPTLDRPYRERMAAALGVGHTLRYTVEVEGTTCTASLREVRRDSPAGALRGANCLLAIHSKRYHPQPLVIGGPGAGPEVTAAGVYADIVSLGLEW
jgi:homoserine dehydrogenase